MCPLRYAAIDPGSTGTRAVIAVVAIDKTTGKRKVVETLRIQDFRGDDDRHTRTTRGEWPSKCCPFDGPPYHVGYDADSQNTKRTISIKAIPYFRTRDDDGHPFTKALYDYCKSLPSRIERQNFDNGLDYILFEFLYGFPVSSLRFCVLPSPPSYILVLLEAVSLHSRLLLQALTLQSQAATRLSNASFKGVKRTESGFAL